MVKANYIFSVFIIVLSISVIISAGGLSFTSASEGYGPNFFPNIVVLAMMILSVLLIIDSYRKKFDEEVSFHLKNIKLPAILILLTVIYTTVLSFIGFITTTTIILVIAMMLLKTKPIKSIITSIIITLILYAGFKLVLMVPLPAGILI